jgi:hypothetical protein
MFFAKYKTIKNNFYYIQLLVGSIEVTVFEPFIPKDLAMLLKRYLNAFRYSEL